MAYPISDVPRRIVYSGSAGVGPYAFTFEVLSATDVAVYRNQTLLTLTTDYTVSINTGTGTGTVTLVVAATGADTVTIVGDRAIQRTSDFVTGGDLFANTLNEELDAQTIYTQQVDEKAERAIRAPVTDPTTINMVLPPVSVRATKMLGFNAQGNPTQTANTLTAIDAAATAINEIAAAPAGNAAGISFLPAGTSAVATTVQAKLRETVSVKDFGAVGDGATDDTVAIQAAITATPIGGVLVFPPGNYITSAALQINNPITLQGTQKNAGSTILCLANDGIEINKVSNVNIYDLCIAQAVRYTTTPNSYTGILVQGDTINRPFNHCYRDVFIDGFLNGIYAEWIWSAVLDNVRTGNGRNGIRARYLSVNNFVTNCSFGGDNQGIGIHLDGLLAGIEGWMITNTLTYANRFGVLGSGATHIQISNCILDYNYESGILITDDGVNFGSNWGITNNYIAISNTSGISSIAGIHIASDTVSSQNRGCQISNNHILTYGGSTCPYGVYADNALANFNVIAGNTFKNFSTNDIRVESENGTITGNTCLSAVTYNIQGYGLIANNTGTVYYQRAVNYFTLGLLKITYDEAIPTTGTWNQGDICYKVDPVAGGVPGWVCVSGGTPGTWKAMANLAA